MIFIAVLLWMMCVFFFQTLMHGNQAVDQDDRNVSISSLISESEIDSWLSDRSIYTSTMAPPTSEALYHNKSDVNIAIPNITWVADDQNYTETSLWNRQLSDQPNSNSIDVMDYILKQPSSTVNADWSTVLGSFDHYDDENWKEFLIKTEVPLIVRLYLADSSETVTISRIFNKKSKRKIHPKLKKHTTNEDFEVLIETGSWLLTHRSQFTLGETYIEHDLDGTDSKNTFYFATPRLLIHNKIKDNWKTAIVRHFDSEGLNMTFIDLDRKIVARRYLKRIS